MSSTISRRSALVTVVAGVIAWLNSRLPLASADPARNVPVLAHSDLIAVCSRLRCPRTIGNACVLALPPSERTRSSLTKTLLADLAPATEAEALPATLGETITKRARIDFSESKTVTVNGWVLSLTEARVYALAALLAEPSG